MSNVRPFRFGIVTESAKSRQEWLKLLQRVEELGYATFLLADHYVNEFPPIAALMAAADATKTLRVGSIVFNNDLRHPALLAKEIATLDLLSDGRFELGIGAGWNKPEYDQIGLQFDSAGVRIKRMEEAIEILKQFFTKESVSFDGEQYNVTDLPAFPKPAQRPHPPIFMGGGGKKMLSISGREANIVGIHFKTNIDFSVDISEYGEASFAQKVEWVREAAGPRFADIELNILSGNVVVTDDRQQAAEQIIRRLEERGRSGLTTEQLLASPYQFIGTVEQICEHIQQLREKFGVSYIVIDSDYMEAFAPVVARLAGK
jgi:probable F420-dependent oxidoreductase